MVGRSKRKITGLPPKGTKLRRLLAMLLREQGVTRYEAIEAGVITPGPGDMGSHVELLQSFKGWDIRRFPCPPERMKVGERKRRKEVIYKVVGRDRPGRYRSFVDPSKC